MIWADGQVSAMKLNEYDEIKNTENTYFIPQIEYFENDKQEHGRFICISKDKKIVKCSTELEALEYAINFRNKNGE